MLDADTADNIARALWTETFDPSTLDPRTAEFVNSAKNSNAAFGERMRGYLQDLKKRSLSFVPSYARRYELFIEHCAELSAHQAYVMSNLLGSDTVEGYELLGETAGLQFPRDHRVFLKYQVGWHFFVGTAKGANGKTYSVELMFWQWTLLPPPVAARFGLSDIENQVMEMHLAVTEEGGRHYRAAPLLIAGTTGLIDVRDDPFRWAIGKNSIESQRTGDFFPLHLKAKGWDRGTGGAGIGTLYYSIPGIVLEAGSWLEIDGNRAELQSGVFWMDHQWGTGFLPSGAPMSAPLRAASVLATPSPGGWDWFPLQFDDNYEITVAAMHAQANSQYYFQTGAEPPGTMTVPVSGKMMNPQAETSDLKGTLSVTAWVKATHSNDAAYPPTGTWYPNRWEFTFDEPAPSHMRNVIMTPLVSGGQMGYFANGAEYLEGGTKLNAPDGRKIGTGFAEATNYANTQAFQAKLAGLPGDETTMNLLKRPVPSALDRIAALLYTIWPPNAKELKRVLDCCSKNGLSP